MTGLDQDFDYRRAPAALLIAAGAEARELGRDALGAVGARLLAAATIDEAPAAIAAHAAADVLLIEAQGAHADALADLLITVETAVPEPRAIIVTLDADQIDLVTAHLLAGNVQLLCAPAPADRVSALAVALAGVGKDFVLERDRDAERLQRLNEEVARIAETLARLTQEKSPPRSSLGDRSLSYRAAPAQGEVRASEVRQAIRLRRLRDQYFGEGLLEDPAWDMLLDLFAADLERAQVSVSSLCIAAAVAPTTALRWIGRMTDEGLLERRPDPFDRRRAFMILSPAARDGMLRYWGAARQMGGLIA